MRKLVPRSRPRIAAEITAEMRAALKAEAQQHGVAESVVLRWALAAYFPALRDGPAAPTDKAS